MSFIAKHKAQILEWFDEGLSKREIARRLGCGESTIRYAMKKWSKEDETRPIQLPISRLRSDVARRKRFVITSALNDCDIHKGFLQALEVYCKKNKAQLLVIPVRYKNVSLYSTPQDPIWPSALNPYYVLDDIELSSNIVIMGSMRIQATASRPLQGTFGISKGRSAVFGHPRIALETVATPMNKFPLVYMTTGSISLPNYSETKAGRLGEFHHQIAAAIVETDGEYFWWRHVHATETGSFTDFETVYTPTGTKPAPRAEVLIPGDIHVGFHEHLTTSALLDPKTGLATKLDVKNVVLHDILDFFSASHHHLNNKVLQVLKERRGRNNVYREVEEVANWLLKHFRSADTNYYIVRSNHHDHLQRWLNRNSEQIDAKNLWFWHHLNALQMKEALEIGDNPQTERDWSVTSAFELALRHFLPESLPFYFHDDREPLEFLGIDCGNHGDVGPNGARGSRSGFSRTQRRTFIGHSHAPGITDGCYQVGKSSRSDLPYMSGYSSHLSCAGLIYADGYRTLFPIINGKYRLEE